jgi:ATP-dependent Lon protease
MKRDATQPPPKRQNNNVATLEWHAVQMLPTLNDARVPLRHPHPQTSGFVVASVVKPSTQCSHRSPPQPEPFDDPEAGFDFSPEERMFLDSLPTEKAGEIRQKAADLKRSSTVLEPLRLQVIRSNLPNDIKKEALNRIGTPREDAKYILWLRNALSLPLCQYADRTPITRMSVLAFRESLDREVLHQREAKEEFVRYMCMHQCNSSSCFAIGLEGVPGIGKTTLAKTALGNFGYHFEMISLSGLSESSFLLGHSFTYEGSVPGRIAAALQRAETMNVCFYFDELDKLSKTPKGDEIAAVLMALIDPSQNSTFRDKYFHGIPLDISKCAFVFSYNNASDVSPILMDRIKIIRMLPPTRLEKLEILEKAIIPKLASSLTPLEFHIDKDVLLRIVDRAKDAGLRSIQKDCAHIVANIFISKIESPQTDAHVVRLETLSMHLPERNANFQTSMYS